MTINGENLSGYGLYSNNIYLTGSILIGDFTKSGNYLEYAAGNLSAVLNELDVTIDASNKIIANSSGLEIKSNSFDFKAITQNVGSIALDSANNKLAMGGYFTGGAGVSGIYDTVAIGADAATPDVYEYDSQTFSADITVSHIAGRDYIKRESSPEFITSANSKTTTIQYDFDDSSFTYGTSVERVRVVLYGAEPNGPHYPLDSHDFFSFLELGRASINIAQRTFIDHSNADSYYLKFEVYAKKDYDFGSIIFTETRFHVTNSTVGINKNGIFQQFGNGYVQPIGSGSSVGSGGSSSSTTSWNYITDNPFAGTAPDDFYGIGDSPTFAGATFTGDVNVGDNTLNLAEGFQLRRLEANTMMLTKIGTGGPEFSFISGGSDYTSAVMKIADHTVWHGGNLPNPVRPGQDVSFNKGTFADLLTANEGIASKSGVTISRGSFVTGIDNGVA